MNGLLTELQYLTFTYKLHICGVAGTADAIDLIRRRYNIIIYNTAEPFVNSNGKVEYGFSVKICNTKFGWNARKYLGKTKWRTNIYQAQREAINIALKWILSQKSQKSKKQKIVAINGSSKTKQN